MLIEQHIQQAIFTSAQTDRLDGYQLAVHSGGIDDMDLRELQVWGPSHDSLLESGEDAVSVNFHPLPSGAYCVSKTTPAGSEYSARTGPRIYTQCLVVPPEVLSRFANNPFALLTAAFAQGSLKVHGPLPDTLEPFRLSGKAATVDQALLAQLLSDPGARWLGALVEAALASPSLALIAGAHGMRLIHGIINCLPPECRAEFSFCTGLKPSPRRPFRIFCLGDDPNDQRRILRQQDKTVLELSEKPPKKYTATAGWGGFIALTAASGRSAFLSQQFAQSRPGLRTAELTALGDQLLQALAETAPAARSGGAFDEEGEPAMAPAAATVEPDALRLSTPPARSAPPADEQHRADAAHLRFLRAVQGAAPSAPPDGLEPDPAQVLGSQCPAAMEHLERLDDTVFEAIAGKPGALDELRQLWPDVLARLGPELIEESREQYLRHALRVWRDCLEGDQIRNPSLAVAAMDVVCLLFDE
ncbi:MAG TPA: hypothetical protein VGN42_14300 [Pirellulales bacterium]|nr:hypothetical protein [Pirellulales bacterium]